MTTATMFFLLGNLMLGYCIYTLMKDIYPDLMNGRLDFGKVYFWNFNFLTCFLMISFGLALMRIIH